MNAVIVDTNVIVIANGAASHASLDCIERCQDRLQQILEQHEKVIVDNCQRILNEYKKYVNLRTQKGIGDVFVKTLLQNQGNPNICPIVVITPLAGNGTDFAEFPNSDNTLAGFHKNDRKFIAVALAYQRDAGQMPTILLAIDRGWFQFTNALASHGVYVDIICEDNPNGHTRVK